MAFGPVFTGSGGGNGIINLGGIPGIQQGLASARPAAGVADGVWYLATDDKILYRWDLTSATWIEELNDGGGGATPNLEQVTTAGNTTTKNIIFKDGASANVAAMGNSFGLGGGAWAITNPGGFPIAGTSQVLYGYINPGAANVQDRIVIGFYNPVDGDVETTYLIHRTNDARRRIYLPNKTGDMLLGNTGAFSQAATAGQTLITIPHGMWPLPDFPTAPANAVINATDAATAAVLQGGYYITTDATNILVHLLVPVVGTPTLNIAWTGIV